VVLDRYIVSIRFHAASRFAESITDDAAAREDDGKFADFRRGVALEDDSQPEQRKDGVDDSAYLSPFQNIPFALARGMFGAINGAEFFGSPTTCKVSQCSTALPSEFIL
jgi:hypothetical protein